MNGLETMSNQADKLVETAAAAAASAPPAQLARQPSKQDLELAAQLIGHAQGRLDGGLVTGGPSSPDAPDHLHVRSAESEGRQMAVEAGQLEVPTGQEPSPGPSPARNSPMESQMIPQENGSPMSGQVCR